MAKRFPSTLARLMSHAQFEPNSGCCLWDGAPDAYGYGRLMIDGHMMLVHRVSWIEHNGPIPDGLQVLHHCDTPPCFNPDHLFLGTHRVNMDDMTAKRRVAFGERSGKAKLTVARVSAIRRSLESGAGYPELAAEHGVTVQNIFAIAHRQTWKHVA